MKILLPNAIFVGIVLLTLYAPAELTRMILSYQYAGWGFKFEILFIWFTYSFAMGFIWGILNRT